MNILSIIQVKILVLIQYSNSRSPPPPSKLYSLSSLEWFNIFEHVVQSLLKHMSFWCPFVDPHLTTYHSNIGVYIPGLLD